MRSVTLWISKKVSGKAVYCHRTCFLYPVQGALKEINDLNGIKINGIIIINIRYCRIRNGATGSVGKVEIESEKLILQLNVKKTYSMARKANNTKMCFKIKDIKQVGSLVYSKNPQKRNHFIRNLRLLFFKWCHHIRNSSAWF